MASLTPPKMRQHARGYYFVHWGGKDHYLGTDAKQARKRYLRSLEEWAEWRALRDQQRRLPPIADRITVADLVEQYLDWKFSQGDADRRRYYAKHLQRFAWTWANWRLDAIRARHLIALQEQMQTGYRKPDGTIVRYAPKTISHDTIAVCGMLRWAMGMEYMPIISLDIIKAPPVGPRPDRSLPIEKIRNIILSKLGPDRERPWGAVNYLTAARPIEVVRIVQGWGRWLDRGIYELDRGKMDMKVGQKRVIILSEEALEWLDQCRRLWSRLDSYSSAVRAACGVGPSHFRYSAAKHLHWAGVDRGDVDLILGHMPSGVTLIYIPIRFGPLRETVSLLTLRASRESGESESASSA